MKRIYITLAVLLGIVRSTWAFSDYDASKIVNDFYNCLKVITEEKQMTERCVVAQNKAISLCYSNESNLPNEFFDFDYYRNDRFIRASTYIGTFRSFSIEKQPIIKAEIVDVQALEEISSNKKEDSKNFYAVQVKKTITVGNIKKEYTDIVRIIAEKGKIIDIANESGGGAGESIISLRGKAAELFASKKYDEAFQQYLKIIEKDPSQGDAYYRLGLMAYHNIGCKHLYSNGKERRRAAYGYIEKARKYGDYKISEYAERVLYYMINGN